MRLFHHLLWAVFGLLSLGALRGAAGGLWDVAALQQVPVVEWGAREGLVQELYYQGETRAGQPTRVFAYLGRPTAASQDAATAKKFPAVVLVHGGGGQAFRAWAQRWAERGYVAIAMDLSGNGPEKKRLADGAPQLANQHIFLKTTADDEFREGWPYYAVAAVIRAHSLLASLPEVDAARVGLTGISWGGYVTSIVASLDPRFKVAVPVYGCGFLHESSFWKSEFFDPMDPAQLARWVRFYDPSSYVGAIRYPILFVNGSNDPRFYLDSHRKTFQTVPVAQAHLAILVGLKHGHNFAIPEVDRFIDAALNGGKLPPQFSAPKAIEGKVSVTLSEAMRAGKAQLHYAAAGKPWVEREWTTVPATLKKNIISAPLAVKEPSVYFFSLIDDKGVRATSAYSEISP